MPRGHVLVVDDDAGARFAVRDFLEAHGWRVAEADGVEAAERSFAGARPEAVVLDHVLADGTALDLLPRLRALADSVPVVVLTGHASLDLAVQAVKLGAEQFLAKPVELPALLLVLERAVANRREHRRVVAGRAREAREDVNPFAGTSAAIRRLEAEAGRILASPSPVLIEGETGTGKGVLARWLHAHGPRADEPFVDLNCAGLSRDLAETELFGHEKGAFTGAAAAKEGLLQVADRGVLFLDEIGDLDPAVQPKLLKALEEQRFRRVGDVRDRRVDVHLVAATHQDLSRLVAERRFREDLFFRISALPLRVPALRERAEDVPVLARRILEGLAHDLGRRGARLTEGAEAALAAHSWPGNIRELRNVLERALLLTDAADLDEASLRLQAPAPGGGASGDRRLEAAERRHIEAVLEEAGGQVSEAARRLGIARSSLYEKLKRYGRPVH